MDQKQKFLKALAYNETRGVKTDPYAYSRPSGLPALGRALGTYQVTEGELKSYAKRYLPWAPNITGKQFLASTTAQDNYVGNKYDYYKKLGYTAQQIADIHRAGFRKSGNPGSTTYQNPAYVESFNQSFNQQ